MHILVSLADSCSSLVKESHGEIHISTRVESMGHQWAPTQGAKACPPAGLQPATHTDQPAPLEEAFSFPPDCGLSGSGHWWGSHLGLHLHSVMAGATGHVGKGHCVTREAGDSSHLLTPYTPVCARSTCTHQREPREDGHCVSAVTHVTEDTSATE